MIFVGQKIGLETTFTLNGTALDISGGTVEWDYWYPGNTTDSGYGTITGAIVSGPDGTAEGTFQSSLNITSGKYLRLQAKVTIGGETYRAAATCEEIYPVGAGCNS